VPGSGLIDAYADVTLMLSYDDRDRLIGIEIGGANAFVAGVQLLDRQLADVLADLRRAGIPPEFAGDQAVDPARVPLVPPGSLPPPATAVRRVVGVW
jgi:hypothetical protein